MRSAVSFASHRNRPDPPAPAGVLARVADEGLVLCVSEGLASLPCTSARRDDRGSAVCSRPTGDGVGGLPCTVGPCDPRRCRLSIERERAERVERSRLETSFPERRRLTNSATASHDGAAAGAAVRCAPLDRRLAGDSRLSIRLRVDNGVSNWESQCCVSWIRAAMRSPRRSSDSSLLENDVSSRGAAAPRDRGGFPNICKRRE